MEGGGDVPPSGFSKLAETRRRCYFSVPDEVFFAQLLAKKGQWPVTTTKKKKKQTVAIIIIIIFYKMAAYSFAKSEI